jgi:parallel beta-helix repeat protein
MRLGSSEVPPIVSRGTTVSPSPGRSWMARCILALSCILLLASATIASAQSDTSSKSKKPKPTPCSITITKCGCTITSPGFYQVQKAIGLPGILNAADNSCIAVSAPHVTLFLGGFAIEDMPFNAGIGIHLTASAKNSFLAGGGSEISRWTNGIEDEASNVTIADVKTDNNTTAGILVQNARGVTVDHFWSRANGSYGVQLNGISGSEISHGLVDTMDDDPLGTNLIAGITLGPSSGVKIFSNCVMGNAGVGIVVQANASNTRVTGNEVTANAGGNLTDMNNDCGSNLWFGNEYDPGSGNPATCTGSHASVGICPTP